MKLIKEKFKKKNVCISKKKKNKLPEDCLQCINLYEEDFSNVTYYFCSKVNNYENIKQYLAKQHKEYIRNNTKQYKRKEIIEAIQYQKGKGLEDRFIMTCDRLKIDLTGEGNHEIHNLGWKPVVDSYKHGQIRVHPGDYLINDIDGCKKVMKKEEFEMLYEQI